MSSLLGRRRECAELDRLVADVVTAGRVLVLRGDAGVGKSALLRYLSSQVIGWRVISAVGVESEMELAYSGLHQLCAPVLDLREHLPTPQREALAAVFGLSAPAAPDPFLVGLATLTLLAEAAARQPLICIVDDAQWLDRASAQGLAFVARRLRAERIALVCAARRGMADEVLAGLPTLEIRGLDDSDARALLLENLHGPLDGAVCDRIIAESHGNPLALLELPRTRSMADLAGGYGLPDVRPIADKIEQSYARRVLSLPPDTRMLLLAAAAEPLGDPLLLQRSLCLLGVDPVAANAASDAGLLRIRGRVEFAHPLVRSAAYRVGVAYDRQRVHRALGDATNADTDPDRRAWHLARAASGPDDDVADELERSAGRAQGRGGVAAAAAFLAKATELTADPARRADRALAAARAHLKAGEVRTARDLLDEAGTVAVNDLQRAGIEQLHAQIEAAATLGREAPVRLLQAARRIESLDMRLARETYLQAWWAAVLAGRFAAPGGDLIAVSAAVRSIPAAEYPRPCDVLLDGLATFVTEGRAAAAPTLRKAIDLYLTDDVAADDWPQWGRGATFAAFVLWDVDSWARLSTRQVAEARATGALASLVVALNFHVNVATCCGDFETAATLVGELDTIKEVTGIRMAPSGAKLLAAYRGQVADGAPCLPAIANSLVERGDGHGLHMAYWATAILNNGLGRYAEASAAAREVAFGNVFNAPHLLAELIEADVKRGDSEGAGVALQRLLTLTVTGSNWSAGVEARARALVNVGEPAERWYSESIACLARTPLRPEQARSHLLYGEWLRGEGRRVDARRELTKAFDMFTAMEMTGFAERSRRELLANGGKAPKRDVKTRDDLTAQEVQIARLARDGLSNTEIAARLFVSPRTVEWHLRKVFAKLNVSRRGQLVTALRDGRHSSEFPRPVR
jgi:DNA-binding CsgD family transcriptional regulator